MPDDSTDRAMVAAVERGLRAFDPLYAGSGPGKPYGNAAKQHVTRAVEAAIDLDGSRTGTPAVERMARAIWRVINEEEADSEQDMARAALTALLAPEDSPDEGGRSDG